MRLEEIESQSPAVDALSDAPRENFGPLRNYGSHWEKNGEPRDIELNSTELVPLK